MLTYAGAEQYVQQIYQGLLADGYALPGCIDTTDEPAGDFGVAHFFGLTPQRCARLTFDNDHIPSAYVVRHEFGHALSAMWNEGSTIGPMHQRWWVERGFNNSAYPTPLAATQYAIWREQNIGLNAGYRYWPEEMFADTFGVVTTLYAWPLTEQLGIYLDQPKMLAFYKSLGDDMFSDADRAVVNRIKDLLDAREALVWIARSQRGRDVETGKIYNPNTPPVDTRIIVP